MRYVDTGSRDPKHALGTWLSDALMGQTPVVAARVQTGYFGADALGYCESTLQALALSDGHTRLLVGSNDGLTPRETVADLLKVVGQPRSGLQVGVVSFQSGLFHPKVFHLQRADGSSTAYVGSANLTVPGTSGKNVEAAVILDTMQGDPQSVLGEIADAVDAWFIEQRPGLYPVSVDADLDPLVTAGVLGVPAPPRTPRTVKPANGGGQLQQAGHSLKQLVALPAIQTSLTPKPTATPGPGGQPLGGAPPGQSSTPSTSASSATPVQPTAPTHAAAVKHWGKVLPASDAQRKATGNQSGAIALTQGDYRHRIDQTDYFRNDLFAQQTWTPGTANTGQPVESTKVPMHVTINGAYHGVLDFRVTNALNRQSSQNNYTAQLHLEPISSLFRQTNMTGKHLEVTLDAQGDYWLTSS